MKKYYTRVCNFYYGNISIKLVKQKKTLPLNGNSKISFDHIEINSRDSEKRINIKDINKLSKHLRKKIKSDLRVIVKKNNNFSRLNFKKLPNIMGIVNLTPDSFSDGGKYNKKNKGYKHSIRLLEKGSDIIDIGGESTRPGSLEIDTDKEWKRIFPTLSKLKKSTVISLDTRKSKVMKKGIEAGVSLINDISGLDYDKNSIKILRKYKTPFVIHHIQGTPKTMQNNPKYKDVVLDIYDYFEKKIRFARLNGINHNNIVIDPGIGFGKNLKHNMRLISKISIFHTLGFPILLGLSRKKFIKEISGINDSKDRIGGTIGSSLFAIMQGVQILRVHDVNEIIQSYKVFKRLLEN